MEKDLKMREIRVKSLFENKVNIELNRIFSPLLTLDPKKIQVFIHGSWADNTKTEFSDLDDFIIVDDQYYNVIKHKLDEVALNFQKLDPLQHHGHWLIKSSQLLQYDNSYMPLFIMEDAICLMGHNEIKASVNEVNAIENTIHRVKNTCKNIEAFYDKYKDKSLNIYDLKRFVSSVVLLPPLLFQIKGRYLNKRAAIENTSKIYSKENLKLIQWSSELRENWKLLIENNTFLDFSKKLDEFDNAEKWRKYASLNAPVINSNHLSDVQINDNLVESFISETLFYIDQFKFQIKNTADYEETFQKIKDISIENKAIIVGQFGSIKYPSISDLDVFICFEDKDYKQGCKAVDSFIKTDKMASYLFTHSPMYVCKSMLHDIKFLHTLYDLKIVYNPLQIKIDIKLDTDYQNFLDDAWSYLIILAMNDITKNIKYVDIRTLLLSLKNAQTSVFKIEERLGISSNELEINHDIRVIVLKEGLKSRKLVEQEYLRVYQKLKLLLLKLDKNVLIPKKEFKISNINYIAATKTENIKGQNIIYVNKVFFNLIFKIFKQSDDNSKRYYNTVKKNLKIHKKYGGYINTYIWVVPSVFVIYNIPERLFKRLKSVVLKVIKKFDEHRHFFTQSKSIL